MSATTHYFTIKDVENILYKDKASKFIGYAFNVLNESEVRRHLENVQLQHPKATHHCYAYRLGLDKNNYRNHDDGEPAGSAGKPILGQLDSHGLSNVLLIVVRYFGGIKLGVSGLISAYKECAKMTLEHTEIIEKKLLAYYSITTDYVFLNKVYQFIQRFKASIEKQEIDTECTFILGIEQEQQNSFEKQLSEEQIDFKFLNIK